MDILTKAIGVFSPSAAFKRMQYQMAMNETKSFMKERKYEGSGRGRRLGSWGLNNGSVNQDISSGLEAVRSRAVFLSQNNPYARNAPKRIANNVVGTGILLSVSSFNNDKKLEDDFLREWKKWAETTQCDFDGRLNFYGLQHLAMRTIHKCGEVIIRRVKIKRPQKNTIPFELQVLDPEFIDTTKHSLRMESGSPYDVNGIRFSSAGKRTHYWIYTSHPKEGYAESKMIPIADICHVLDIESPGQVRGMSEFSSVINRMKDFDELEDAELYKQKISSCFVAFRSRPSVTIPSVGKEIDRIGNSLDRMSPGIIQDLQPGEQIQFGTPPVSPGFSDMARQNLQGQAIGLGLSYESYTGDLSNVNFSSGRMGWIESFRNIEHWQWNIMLPMFLNPVFEWFNEAAKIAGIIPSIDFIPSWTAPKREMIDPSKETGAVIEAVLAGLISWDDAVKQSGYNPDELLAAMKSTKERFDAAGILPTSDPRYEIMLKTLKNANSKSGNQ